MKAGELLLQILLRLLAYLRRAADLLRWFTSGDAPVLAARISEYGLDTAAERRPDLNVYDALLAGAGGTK